MTKPVFILAGQSNAARLSIEIEASLDAQYGAGNYELVRVFEPGAPLTRERDTQSDWSDPDELRDELTTATVDALLEDDDRVLTGVIWVQGEADTYYSSGAAEYADTLTDMFADFRNDVSDILDEPDAGVDDAVVTILELSDNAPAAAEREAWDMIVSAQQDVASDDPLIQTLNPDDVASEENVSPSDMFSDGLHYSDEFSSILADRLVETFDEPDDVDEPTVPDDPEAPDLPLMDISGSDPDETSDEEDEDVDSGGMEALMWLMGIAPIFGLLAGVA